jgi:hypothetical protein
MPGRSPSPRPWPAIAHRPQLIRPGLGRVEIAMTARRAGLAIAVAAILVQAPRLVLALLAADRLPVAPGTERALLVLAGIGTALVLTGGNLYLAHTVAQVQPWRRTLAAAWITVLAASGGLALPLIVAGLTARTLPQVLGARQLEWPWALLAAIAHELTAAGCVLASAAWAGTACRSCGSQARSAAAACRHSAGRRSRSASSLRLAAAARRRLTRSPPDPLPRRLRQKLPLAAGSHRIWGRARRTPLCRGGSRTTSRAARPRGERRSWGILACCR